MSYQTGFGCVKRGVILCIFAGLIIVVLPFRLYAVHKGAGELTCGNCHTMHNSQGNSSMEGVAGGSVVLLRGQVTSRAEIHKLCLQCHASNGAQAPVTFAPQNVKAPKVYSNATWTDNDPFNLIGAGGNFYWEIDSSWDPVDTSSLGRGHSLGTTNITPPGKAFADSPLSYFTCTNCHDPHGTADPNDPDINIFRNLRVRAVGSGQNGETGTVMQPFVNDPTKPYREHLSYVGGVNGTYFGGSETDNAGEVIWPVYTGTLTGDPNTDSGNSNSYGTGNEYKPGVVTMSRWCAQCHDNWHEDIETTNLDRTEDMDSRRHAVNSVVPRGSSPTCATGCHVSMLDRANYTTSVITAGKGLPVTASAYYTGTVYYLPYTTPCNTGNPSCMDNAYGGVTGDNHKVFCLSCHFAHGGPYYDALRWDYNATVSAGSQKGNGIPANKGCQLCHNR